MRYLLFVLLLLSPAFAQPLGTISRELPNQILVYEVRRQGATPVKKGDIVKVEHAKGVGEATVMTVADGMLTISLKGVYEVAPGNVVSWSRSPNASTASGWTASAGGRVSRPIPTPAGFTLYTDEMNRYSVALPPSVKKKERDGEFNNMFGPYYGGRPDFITLDISVSQMNYEEAVKEYKYLGDDGRQVRTSKGKIKFGENTYETLNFYAPLHKSGGSTSEFTYVTFIFASGETYELLGTVEVQKDRNLIERSMRSFKLLK